MEETITQRESVVTNPAGSEAVVNRTVEHKSSNQQTIANLIYFVFGALELVLLFRFVLRLMGANPASGFVSFVYGLSRPFVITTFVPNTLRNLLGIEILFFSSNVCLYSPINIFLNLIYHFIPLKLNYIPLQPI